MRIMRQQRGFTLLEVMLAILILAIAFGILGTLVQFSTRYFREENSQLANQDGIRLVYVQFDKDLRKYGVDPTIYTATSGCYTLGTTTLSRYCYNSSTKQITRTFSGTTTVIGKEISSFSAALTPGSDIRFLLTSVNDNRGNNNTIDVRLFLRK